MSKQAHNQTDLLNREFALHSTLLDGVSTTSKSGLPSRRKGSLFVRADIAISSGEFDVSGLSDDKEWKEILVA